MTTETEAPAFNPGAAQAERRDAAVSKLASAMDDGPALGQPAETPEAQTEAQTEAQAETPAETPAEESAETPAEKPDPWAKVKERAQETRQKREQEQAKQQEISQVQLLQQQIEALKGQHSISAWSEKAKKNPRQAIIDLGLEPTEFIQQLTTDMMSPGAAELRTKSEEGDRVAQQLQERIAQLERQHLVNAQAAQIRQTEQEFADFTSDSGKVPLMSKLDKDTRLSLGVDMWRRILHAEGDGASYDHQLVADLVEHELSKIQQALVGDQAPSEEPEKTKEAASAGTEAPPKKQAPKTLTADLAGQSSGAPRESTRAERKKRLIQQLDRKFLEARAK